MALFVIDGVPGAGKTLNTIKEVRDRATKEVRPVFYNYITDLSDSLGWEQLTDEQIKNWHNDLPEGSILVVDEAWRHFPKWETKKQPPDYVLAFFQHRKKGHDVYLIVQSARVQLDPVVYENTEAHIHFQRVAGSQLVKRFEWNGTVGNPKSASSIAVARVSFQRLDADIFKLYKSAEIHTHKFRPPMKFILALALLVLCLFTIGYNSWKAKQSFSNRDGGAMVSTIVSDNAASGAVIPSQTSPAASPRDSSASLDLASYKPRVPKMAWTAPAYDHLRQPKSYPRPAACMLNIKANICKCYTQQATPLDVPDDFCRLSVSRSTFDDQIPDRAVLPAEPVPAS